MTFLFSVAAPASGFMGGKGGGHEKVLGENVKKKKRETHKILQF